MIGGEDVQRQRFIAPIDGIDHIMLEFGALVAEDWQNRTKDLAFHHLIPPVHVVKDGRSDVQLIPVGHTPKHYLAPRGHQ